MNQEKAKKNHFHLNINSSTKKEEKTKKDMASGNIDGDNEIVKPVNWLQEPEE